MEFLRKSQFILYGMKNFIKRKEKFPPLVGQMEGVETMVTGATAGLGLGITKDFASRGATVHMICRNKEKGEAVRKQIMEETKNNRLFLHICDMSSMKDIKNLAEQYIKSNRPLHVLVNNAGCMINNREKTAEGIEKNFATNTLGTYLLTKLLVPALKRSQPSKVITVSSGGMLTQKLELKDMFMDDSDFDGTKQYAKNKRQQIAMTEFFSACYERHGVHFYTMHPGWVDTDGVKDSMPDFHKRFKDDLRQIDEGIDTVIWLALQPVNQLKQAEFYFDREIASKHLTISSTSYEPEQTDALIGRLQLYLAQLGVL